MAAARPFGPAPTTTASYSAGGRTRRTSVSQPGVEAERRPGAKLGRRRWRGKGEAHVRRRGHCGRNGIGVTLHGALEFVARTGPKAAHPLLHLRAVDLKEAILPDVAHMVVGVSQGDGALVEPAVGADDIRVAAGCIADRRMLLQGEVAN